MNRIVFLILLFICCCTFSFAQKSKLKDLENQRKQALLEIQNTDRLLKDTKINTSSLINRIKLISSQIEARQRVVHLLEQEVESMAVEEEHITKEVEVLEGELNIKKAAYEKAVTSVMRNRQNDNKLLFVLSGRSLTESYRRFLYLKDYSDWRRRQAEEIKNRNIALGLKQDSLQLAKKEKESLLKNRATEQEKLQKEEDNYHSEVSIAEEKQKDLQRILDQKKKQAQALDRQIEKLIADEIARQEKKAKREKEEADRKAKVDAAKAKPKPAETATSEKPGTAKPDDVKPKPPTEVKPVETTTSTKENIALSSNFATNKGKLPYPITGRYTITSRFGTNKQSKWVTTSSGGIDIQSESNAAAKAVFGGEVTSVVSIPGYGTCILIRHGSYYTFYGNIQSIAVKKGDKVTTGQSLGTIYTDPDTNISQMHFQLWQNKTKQNPELWLR